MPTEKYSKKRAVRILEFLLKSCQNEKNSKLRTAILRSGDSDLSSILAELCINLLYNKDIRLTAKQRSALTKKSVNKTVNRLAETENASEAGRILRRLTPKFPIVCLIRSCQKVL